MIEPRGLASRSGASIVKEGHGRAGCAEELGAKEKLKEKRRRKWKQGKAKGGFASG